MKNISIKINNYLCLIFVCPVLLYRRLKFGCYFRKIYLGENEWTIVDPMDYYWLRKYNWYLGGNGKNYYAFTNIKTCPGKTKIVGMHRLIINPPEYLLVDHRNNNTLDNRHANLRLATHSQNACNRPKISSKTSSRYIGVYFEKRTGRWTSKIRVNGKRLWLGRFKDELDAALAYDKAARQYHKEFARLNFPETLTETDLK
jgi:hypothetical protein